MPESEVAVRLTNKREIPMMFPDGQGNTVELAPGESKIVWGDYAYFRRMPAQGVSGLVVKKEPGTVRLVEDGKKKDVGLFKITNNRQIPMLLATGVERRKHVEIGPGETVEVVARESVVKQMSGITVKVMKPVAVPPPKPKRAPTPPPVAKAAPKVKAAVAPPLPVAPLVKVPSSSLEQDLAEALAKPSVSTPEPPLTPVGKLKAENVLPETREGWEIKAKDNTWHDLRGIAKELGVRGRGRESLTKNIGDEVYGE